MKDAATFRFYLIALLATVTVSLVATRLAYGRYFWPELASAWVLTALHGSGAWVINRRALNPDTTRFLLWGVGINGVRVLLLLATILMVHWLGVGHFQPFLVTTLIGYFCFLFSEVSALHVQGLKDTTTDE